MSLYAKDGQHGEMQPMRTARVTANKGRYYTGGRLTERLAAVATTYLLAKDQGRSTTTAVAVKFEVTAGNARQLVRRARRAGLIPPV